MKCALDDFDVLTKPVEIEKGWGGYTFCPGKATWFEHAGKIYEDCRIALETGILPREGSLEDQDTDFTDVFPGFVTHWRDRQYERIWDDIRSFTRSTLEAVLGKKGNTKKG